jgi:ribosomal protein S18 acetylase RimI-like enzyme
VGEASLFVNDGQARLGMVVSMLWRRRGVGHALLNAIEGYCREHSLSELGLEVYAHNDAAIALYRSAGFVEDGERGIETRPDGQQWTIVPMKKPLEAP